MTIFSTERVDDSTLHVMRETHILAGSIGCVGEVWHVEIMWSGPGGDIVYDAPSLPAAMAFLDGVEKGFLAMGVTE